MMGEDNYSVFHSAFIGAISAPTCQRRTKMSIRNYAAGGLALAVVTGLGVAVAASSANAAGEATWKVKEIANMTCGDFLKTKETLRPGLVYWIDGHRHRGRNELVVRQNWFDYSTAGIAAGCNKSDRRTVAEVIRDHHGHHGRK
jgi:HdeA/HdeB family protein